MKVLLTAKAQKDVSNSPSLTAPSLGNVVSRLERLDLKNLASTPKVHRVSGTAEKIYVLRERGVRVFFTSKGTDIVVLSIEDSDGV